MTDQKEEIMDKPLVIAGPCMAESYELLDEVAAYLVELERELGFRLVLKGSFDKANRTSSGSYRGPGFEQACDWFSSIKEKYGVKALTDIHEEYQAEPAGKVWDWLQIPAFLCRQTNLLTAAALTGRWVNIKKGQFMAPGAMGHIVEKARSACREADMDPNRVAVTERGTTFGYGDLIADMRSLKAMAKTGAPVIYDVTHSTQQPPTGEAGVSGALRDNAALLARAAAATGYLSGVFLEVHPNPDLAKSDADAQLNFAQAKTVLAQSIEIMRLAKPMAEADIEFD